MIRSPAAFTSSRSPGSDLAKNGAVAGHLRAGVGPLQQLDLDELARGHHYRAIREGMRTDRRHDQRIEVRLDDRTAAGQGVGSRAGRARDDDTVAGVGVDISPADPSLEIQHPPGRHLLQHDVVERERFRDLAARLAQAGGEQRTFVGLEPALERGIDAAEHVLGHHVGQEPEPSAIDAEKGYAMARDEARRVEQGAVAADRDHEVGAAGELDSATRKGQVRNRPWHPPDRAPGMENSRRVADEHLNLPGRQMRQQGLRGLRDARVHESADQRARADGEGHPRDRSRTAVGLLDGRLGRL